jgi:hypothetical protein
MNQTTKNAIQAALDAIAHASKSGWAGITWDSGVPAGCPWVPNDGSPQWQQYRKDLADAIEEGGDLDGFIAQESDYVTEQADEARELGDEAAGHLRDALHTTTLDGAAFHIDLALNALKSASAIERAFGDDPTWGSPLKACGAAVKAIEEHETLTEINWEGPGRYWMEYDGPSMEHDGATLDCGWCVTEAELAAAVAETEDQGGDWEGWRASRGNQTA